MEIERKFLVMTPPENYESFPCHEIEQAYLCTEPVIRVRKEDDTCYLTYKSKGLLAREEYNLPLTKEAYTHLLTKADGNILTKKRYLIPVVRISLWNSMSSRENSPVSCLRRSSLPARRMPENSRLSPGSTGM